MFPLESIGADSDLRRECGEVHGADLGRVASVYGEEFDLFTDAGVVRAECSGALRYGSGRAADLPTAGDWVAARIVDAGRALVVRVLPRRSCVSRRAAGERTDEQLLAANVDVALIVSPLDAPYNAARVDRYVALAAQAGVQPVIVLTKSDMARFDAAPAVKSVTVSAIAGTGIAEVRDIVGRRATGVLLGPSGAGKSTLVNALCGAEVQATRAVRDWDLRGRHTTTRRDLIPLPGGGALIDTPGLREIQLWADAAAVDSVFDDIVSLAAKCRFGDCAHAGEPGCAVASAVQAGALAPERLRSWQKLRREARRQEGDIAETIARKQRLRAISRAIRVHYKARE